MKKKLAVGFLTLALMIGGATTVFADTNVPNELKDLYQQLFTIQKQIIDKQVEAGAMNQEEAKSAKKFLDQNQEYRNQAIDKGDLGGFNGQHCGNNGSNMMNRSASPTNYNS